MRCIPSSLLLALPLTLTACGDAGELAPPTSADAPDAARPEPAPAPAEVPEGELLELDPALTGGRPIEGGEGPAALPDTEPPAPNRFDPGAGISDEQLDDYYVAMTCAVDGQEVGTLTLDLWGALAPITVRNFLRLCDTGFYEGVTFHRILREFMVQGGDPSGTGSGDGPYGMIPAEFSDDPERAHRYGVISMARKPGQENSASCQFYICCADGPDVWNLDGDYASFGRLASGVQVLEALADVPVGSAGGQQNRPTVPVTIVRTEVIEGAAPSDEEIARPVPDIGDEPRELVFQNLLVSFQGVPQSPATRTREEAAVLVAELVEKARAGEDFNALVLANTDAMRQPGDETPGRYHIRNSGVTDLVEERAFFELFKKAQSDAQALQNLVTNGALEPAVMQDQMKEIQARVNAAQEALGRKRSQLPEKVGDLVFGLEVGEVEVLDYDPNSSPEGWHIFKRLE